MREDDIIGIMPNSNATADGVHGAVPCSAVLILHAPCSAVLFCMPRALLCCFACPVLCSALLCSAVLICIAPSAAAERLSPGQVHPPRLRTESSACSRSRGIPPSRRHGGWLVPSGLDTQLGPSIRAQGVLFRASFFSPQTSRS